MNTEDLIIRLASEARRKMSVGRGVATAFAPGLVMTLLFLVLGWGFRSDLAAAMTDPLTSMKLLLPGLVALVAVGGALRLARPDGRAGGTMASLAVVVIVALILVAVGLAQTPAYAWGTAVRGDTLIVCLVSIPTLALLPTIALLLALRRGASLAPVRSGALAGLGGGAAAAALFALHCTEDNPLFFVTWYGTAILLVSGLGALLGPRLLRW